MIRPVESDGRRMVNEEGSHRQYKHPSKPRNVTIAGKPGNDVRRGVVSGILKGSWNP